MTEKSPLVRFLGLALVMAGSPALAQEQIEAVADAALPSLVVITGYDEKGTSVSQGIGFLIGDEKFVVASFGAVARAQVVEVRTSDGEYTYASEVVSSRPDWNVALLRTDEPAGPPGLPLSPEPVAKLGEEVVVIGLPVAGAAFISAGSVVALHEHAGTGNLLQITNNIGPSASGGPLLDLKGRVVGVARRSSQGVSRVSFAVPSGVLGELIADADGEPERTLSAFSDEVERTKAMLRNFRSSLQRQCTSKDLLVIDNILVSAISSGIGIYNSGDHLSCYLIYEGAGYRILYTLQNRCQPATSFLARALAEADQTVTSGKYSSIPGHKAWIMRIAFDSLLGAHDEQSGFGPENID